MELRLFQKDVTAIYYPSIFGFLGYCTFKLDVSTFPGKMKAYRYLNGLTQKLFSKLINLAPAFVGRWGNGKGHSVKKELVEAFLSNFSIVVNQDLTKGINSD
ncbi:Uncharacterised protein [Sphingobacterium daejeonense]|nr:Uncharacterised protein [Sphingobacterium daejeonense]